MDTSLDFSALIDSAGPRALPRPAVDAELQRALGTAASGLVVLRGEPGSGKTCIVTRHLRAHGGLHHFLRQGHTEQGLWRDAHGFLVSIALQLQRMFGDDLFPSTVAVDVDQRLHLLREGASLTGVHVERLYALPWTQLRLAVRQDVDEASGKVIGVRIGELIDEVHRIPLPVMREVALVAPLRRLREIDANARVALWIDALDEDAAGNDSSSAASSITSILPNAEELSAIGNLHLVIASRPFAGLARLLEGPAVLIDLDDARFDDDRRAFVVALVERELQDPAVRAALQAARVEPASAAVIGADDATLTSTLNSLSHGNALYLAQFFDAVRAGELPRLVAGGLPSGLDAIHARLASALARRSDFARIVHPLLAVLAAARRPLQRAQLARFAALSEQDGRQGLGALDPYIDESRAGYALYHRAFQETLVSSEHAREVWSVNLADANDRIARAYLPEPAGAPQGIDDYGLAFLAAHLAHGSESSRMRLLDLPNAEWWRLRCADSGSLWPVLSDLELALKVARELPASDALPVAARLALLAGRIHDAERSLPENLLGTVARLGQVQRALDAVSPEMRPEDQATRLAAIAQGLASAARGGTMRPDALLRQILEQGLACWRRDGHGYVLADLLDACPRESANEMRAWIEAAAEEARRLPPDWRRPRAIVAVARLQACLDREVGRAWFRSALKDCADNLRSSFALEQHRLVSQWLSIDPEIAGDLLPQLRLASDAYSMRTALEVGRTLESNGHGGALADLAGQVGQAIASFADPYQRALAAAELGAAWHEAGNEAAALQALGDADAARGRIGADDDPDRNLQNRPSMAADTVFACARLARQLGTPDAAKRIEEAWSAFGSPGTFNVSAEQLVALQMESEPDLLEVYLRHMPASAQRLKVRLAAIDALLERGDAAQDQAQRWVRQAIIEARDIGAASSSTPYVEHALRVTAAPEHLDAVIDQAREQVPVDEWVAAQIAVWPRRGAGREQRRAALAAMVDAWATSARNISFVFDLPELLLGFSSDDARDALDLPEPAGTADCRCLFALTRAALSERLHAGSGRAAFDAAVAAIDASASANLPAAALRAFAAGAWWSVDPARSAALWTEALAWLECQPAFRDDAQARHTWLMSLARAVEVGSPQAALHVLLTAPEPPPAPGTMVLYVPGVGVDPLKETGMSQRDVALARGLARFGMANADLARPAVRALALINATSSSPASRLQQLDAALAAAREVHPPSLAALLCAQAVRAMASLGVQRRAREAGAATAEAVVNALPVFGTVPMSGYAAAIGHLAAAALAAEDIARSATLIFEARRLGVEGVDRALAVLCAPLVEAMPAAWQRLDEQVRRARMEG